MNESQMIDAAKLIRPYLADLVGEEQALTWDRRLAALIADQNTDPHVVSRIRTVLWSDDTVAQWVEDLFDDPDLLPPDLQRHDVRGPDYRDAPGQVGPIAADRFVCPEKKDFIWYRPFIGDDIRWCPTCKVQLVQPK